MQKGTQKIINCRAFGASFSREKIIIPVLPVFAAELKHISAFYSIHLFVLYFRALPLPDQKRRMWKQRRREFDKLNGNYSLFSELMELTLFSNQLNRKSPASFFVITLNMFSFRYGKISSLHSSVNRIHRTAVTV